MILRVLIAPDVEGSNPAQGRLQRNARFSIINDLPLALVDRSLVHFENLLQCGSSH